MSYQHVFIHRATLRDVPEIKLMSDRHNAFSVPEEDEAKGFLTLSFSSHQLRDLIDTEAGVQVARDAETNQLVGFVMGAPWQWMTRFTMCQYLTEIMHFYALYGLPLSEDSCYHYGPICVDEMYRKHGVGSRLLDAHLMSFGIRYYTTVGYVNVRNLAGMEFHLKAGFKVVGEFPYNGERYNLVAMKTDARKQRPALFYHTHQQESR